MLHSISLWLLEATLRGSILIACIWLMRPLLRRWLGARATHLIWLAVVVQLLAPWLPSSPLSLLPKKAERTFSVPVRNVQISVRVDDVPREAVAAIEPPSVGRESKMPQYLMGIWAAGVGAIMALSLLRALRAARLVASAKKVGEQELLQAALGELPDVPRRLRIRETAELRSPALCGVLRPTILLPAGWSEHFSTEELSCVLLHEIGHFRRADLVWHWMFLLARAVHWFNPLVWLAERSARADQEMACDEWVLSRSQNLNEQSYGEVLLKASRMIGVPRLASPLHATMAESKSGLTRRIRHLAQVRAHGWCALAGSLALALALILMVAPSRSTAQEGTAASIPEEAPKEKQPEPVIEPVPTEAKPLTAEEVKRASELAKRPLIEIEARFVELSGEGELSLAGKRLLGAQEYKETINSLHQRKGVDLVAGPRVTVRSGQRATIEIIREFRYPTRFEEATDGSGYSIPKEFETRNAGVTLETLPDVMPDGRIELVLIPEIVEFEGFINYRSDQPARPADADPLSALMKTTSATHILTQPVFTTRKLSTRIVLKPGETAIVGGMSRKDEQRTKNKSVRSVLTSVNQPTIWPPEDKTTHPEVTRALYLFVTAHLVDRGGNQVNSIPAQKPQEPRQAQSNPAPIAAPLLAFPVPGKPGFVVSPHAPEAGYVDVRGYPSGQQVKCPYSSKFFAVP